MKILVGVKRVIDYNVQIRVKSDGSGIETENVKMSMNPPDENALEEAVRLKEQGIATEIVAVSIGSEKSKDVLKTALAIGADTAIHILAENNIEPLAVAKILQKINEQQKADIILLGKQAIDDDSNQTGQMLASLLDYPQGTFISNLKVKNNQAQVVRETDDGLVTLNITLPAVLTADLRLNEPRFPSLPNIMKAKKKPMETITVADLGVDIKPRLITLEVTEPPMRSKGIMVNSVDELIDKLKNEKGVI